MSACRRTAERLAPFVDGALPAEERSSIDRHLEQCGPCRRAVDEAHGGRAVLRSAAARLPGTALPPGLRSRCETLAQAHRRRSVTSWIQRLVPAAAAAGIIFCTVLIVFALASRRSNVLLAQQLTLDHVKCFHLFGEPEQPMDPRTAEELLAGYGWQVRVPPSSAANGVTFVGARRCLYTSGTIPHMMYRFNGEEMSLFVLDGEQRQEAQLDTLGHRSRIWLHGGSTYVLVSPRETDALGAAAQYLQQEHTR